MGTMGATEKTAGTAGTATGASAGSGAGSGGSGRRAGLERLVTTVRPNRGYAKDQRADPGVFVCPRADIYGGRDGVIPPAVAVSRGLVPRGMRESTNEEIAAARGREAADGRSERERYLDYYDAGTDAQEPQEPQEPHSSGSQGEVTTQKPY